MLDDNYEPKEPKENLTPEERQRRMAMPLGQDYRFTNLNPKTIAMNPPRGEDVKIPSKGGNV